MAEPPEMVHRIPSVKFILTILSALALFTATGCVFRGDRDDRHRPAEHPNGVDHGEYPGDMNHGPTMQR